VRCCREPIAPRWPKTLQKIIGRIVGDVSSRSVLKSVLILVILQPYLAFNITSGELPGLRPPIISCMSSSLTPAGQEVDFTYANAYFSSAYEVPYMVTS
jgi:hypothetical protein